MNTSHLFVESFFDTLQQKGIGYCILRNADEIRRGDAHDIDMTVDVARLTEAGECLFSCAEKRNWRLHFAAGSFRDVYHFKPLHFYHIEDDGSVSIVHFDICPTFAWNGYVIVSNATLLRGRDEADCYHTVHPAAEAVIDFFIRLLYNGYIKDKYKERIHDFFRDYPQQVRRNLMEIISEEHAETLMHLVSAHDWEAAASMRPAFIRDIKKNAVSYRLSLVLHKLRKLWHYPGIMMAVEGCEGSCTSALIEGLRPVLKNTFTEEGIIYQQGIGTDEDEKVSGHPASPLMLICKTAKVIFHYWISLRRKLGIGYMIANERYYGAAYLNNNSPAAACARLLCHFIPKADITIVLLSETVEQQKNAYIRHAVRTCKNVVILDADQPMGQVVNKAATAIMETMATRYRL